MRHIHVILTVVLVVGLTPLFAQKDQSHLKQKRGKPGSEVRGNPGDPTNANADQDTTMSKQAGGNDAAEERNDATLLGDDNKEAEGTPAGEGATSSEYRDNKVSGNPNNRSTNEGSNNQTARPGNTTESSASDNDPNAMNTGTGQAADPDASNVPAVMQQNTSSSGSPAMPAEEKEKDRDGTNNVQQAKPNMAGSPVRGIRYSKKARDTDREIRRGSVRQQTESVGNDVSRTRNKGQRGQQQSQQRQMSGVNPHPTNQGSINGTQADPSTPLQGEQEGTTTMDQDSVSMTPAKKKEDKKSRKKKKRRNRD